jgi:hypothetical protein
MTSSRFSVALLNKGLPQSGHSLHEHSYKMDADLSDIGWEYAARLKDFVLERRAKSLKERGLDPKTSRLMVRPSTFLYRSTLIIPFLDMDFRAPPFTSHCVAIHEYG